MGHSTTRTSKGTVALCRYVGGVGHMFECTGTSNYEYEYYIGGTKLVRHDARPLRLACLLRAPTAGNGQTKVLPSVLYSYHFFTSTSSDYRYP
eukprot:scaffold305340_cov36-Prasinocladus_malaysianus.AAC.1